VERINGEPALTSSLSPTLEQAGFVPTPRGLRVRR
jgi:ATP-dependent Lhr-like helicase